MSVWDELSTVEMFLIATSAEYLPEGPVSLQHASRRDGAAGDGGKAESPGAQNGSQPECHCAGRGAHGTNRQRRQATRRPHGIFLQNRCYFDAPKLAKHQDLLLSKGPMKSRMSFQNIHLVASSKGMCFAEILIILSFVRRGILELLVDL